MSNRSGKFDTGALIKKLRGGLTQEQFAEEMGVGRTTVLRYESNERVPDADFLLRLNVRYGVDPLHVLTGRRSDSAALNKEEADLVAALRRCSSEDRALLLAMANSLACKTPV